MRQDVDQEKSVHMYLMLNEASFPPLKAGVVILLKLQGEARVSPPSSRACWETRWESSFGTSRIQDPSTFFPSEASRDQECGLFSFGISTRVGWGTQSCRDQSESPVLLGHPSPAVATGAQTFSVTALNLATGKRIRL